MTAFETMFTHIDRHAPNKWVNKEWFFLSSIYHYKNLGFKFLVEL